MLTFYMATSLERFEFATTAFSTLAISDPLFSETTGVGVYRAKVESVRWKVVVLTKFC